MYLLYSNVYHKTYLLEHFKDLLIYKIYTVNIFGYLLKLYKLLY